MILSQPSNLQRLMKTHGKVPLLTTPQNEEKVLEMASATASIVLSEEAKWEIELLSDAMNSVCYI